MSIKIEFQSVQDLMAFLAPPLPKVVTVEKEVYKLSKEKMRSYVLGYKLDCLYRDNKITFIKFVRELTGMSLREAKEFVEEFGV